MLRALRAGLALLLVSAFAPAIAQPLSAFVNIQNQVMVWDNGILRKVDFLPPIELKVGRSAIPYLDNTRSFKIYYGGGTRTVNLGFTSVFEASDNLVLFLNARSLNVFDRGTIKNLSGLCQQYYLGDSLILFLDGVRNEYKAYYNGEVFGIENFLAETPIQNAKVSDNIAAYINYAAQFRIFWHGAITNQEDVAIESFEVGRNTVAYVDASRRFRVFHSGKTLTLDEYAPRDYAVGDNVVAFVTNDGYFKIFYNDSVQTVGFFRPDYVVSDNIVAYRDAGGYFQIFYKGEIYKIDSYYPSSFTAQYNSMAYVDRGNVLRLFTDGELYEVTNVYGSYNESDLWTLNYDVLRYRIGPSMYRVYYRGEDYGR